MTTAPVRRNPFQDLFSGARNHVASCAVPASKTRLTAQRRLIQAGFDLHLPAASPEAPDTSTSRDAAQRSTVDTSWFRPSAPVSLQALSDALRFAGLDPGQFRVDQLEADANFPGRPDLSYTTRQLLIRGPHGEGLFDRDLALRTPWVTAVELRSYGIA